MNDNTETVCDFTFEDAKPTQIFIDLIHDRGWGNGIYQ